MFFLQKIFIFLVLEKDAVKRVRKDGNDCSEENMRNFTTQVILVMSSPDGMNDQEVFSLLNKRLNPQGIDFIWPAFPGIDKPVIAVRVLRAEEPAT